MPIRRTRETAHHRTLAAWLLAWLAVLTLPARAEDDPLKPPAIETQNVPPIPAELVERLQQYMSVRDAEFRDWAPDGRGLLVQTRFGETAQLHRVYEPGGRREQLTFFSEPANGRFVPESRDGSLLVVMSTGGDENYQIYRLDGSSGRSVRLTDGTSRNLLGPVSEDGSRMIVASNRRNGRDTDLYLADTRVPAWSTMVWETEGEYWIPEDLSADGQRLLMNRYVSINETYPAVLDLAGGEKSDIPSPGVGPTAYGALKFTREGRHAYAASDAAGEFQQLALIDLKTHQHSWLAPDISWDVTAIDVSRDRRRAAFTVNENGASALYVFSGEPVEIEGRLEFATTPPSRIELPLGIVETLKFSEDGMRLGFTLARPDAPADTYSYELGARELRRWTYSEVGGLDPETFIAPEQIRYPTFDDDEATGERRQIPAYFFRPRGASAEKPGPVLVHIHGGPEGQYRPDFSGFDQFLLNEMGIAVIRPNVRGSAGYGKSYLKLDNATKREDSVRDIGALLDWIATQPELDAERVAVIGGSYGGYMVLGSLVHYSDRLKAGIDVVGIASFRTFLENTSEYRRDLRRAEYGDERDPEIRAFFDRIDPLHNAEKITAELFVAHGKNDPRVPFSEAEQIAEKVRTGGREVWTVYAANEGHGFAKKANRDYLYAAIALFLRERLK